MADVTFVRADNGGMEDLNTIASSASDPSIDIADGNVVDLTLDDSPTLTFTGSTSGFACAFTLILRQDGTGSRTVTWPASVVWAGGTAPTLSTAASAIDIIVFLTVDNGTTWFGMVSGQDFS